MTGLSKCKATLPELCNAPEAKSAVAALTIHAYVEANPQKDPMPAKVRFANRHFHLPQSKPLRLGLGILLVAGGLVGFLPVVGFWMIPLGLLVLSVDIPIVRRWRRRLAIWWHRDRKEVSKTGAPPSDVPGTKVG